MIDITLEMISALHQGLNSPGTRTQDECFRIALKRVAPLIALQIEAERPGSDALSKCRIECARLNAHNDTLKGSAAKLKVDLQKARARLNQAEVQLHQARMQHQATAQRLRAMLGAVIDAAINAATEPAVESISEVTP